MKKYLRVTTELNIRFSETDAMGVVWHGNYFKFFEDVREHFGLKYGIDYLKIAENGYFIPIIHSEIQYKSPIYYGQKAQIMADMHYSKAAKMCFSYTIINLTSQQIATQGNTTQVYIDSQSRELILNKPSFMLEWEEQQAWITQD